MDIRGWITRKIIDYLTEPLPHYQRFVWNDPQALRRWPAAKMPAFDSKVLPDRELAELVAYLRHMADRKVLPPVK